MQPLTFDKKLTYFFNVVSATLWFCCFARFLILLPLVGRRFLPGGIADFFHVCSLFPLIGAVLLIVLGHKSVSSSIWSITGGLKMAWICYGVIFPHPKIAKHTTYSILITAWCTQYLTHFTYYAFRVRMRYSPALLHWFEFNNFYLTFPLQTAAEMLMLFLSLAFVEEGSYYEAVLKAAFISYIPVAYFTWGHLKRRRIAHTTVRATSTQPDDLSIPPVTSEQLVNQQ